MVDPIQARVSALIERCGLRGASDHLGLAPETTLRLATPGCQVQRATRTHAELRLDEVENAEPAK